jgi:ribosomal protein S18 acetylase RimI-like enzyme
MGIRAWEERDIPAVAGLLRQLEAALGEAPTATLEGVRAQFARMGDRAFYECYVHEAEEGVAGFLSLVFYRSPLHREGTALVNELVVDQGLRGRGIGQELLRHAVTRARARGMDEIEVGVERGNAAALAFYRRNGIAEEYVLLGREFDRASRRLP